MTSVSVVIGTRNRCDKLRACLQHLAACRVPDGTALEVVVVDNNSTDSTREVVAEAASSAAVSVRYVFEPRKGVSCARNAGIATAIGDIIAIVDDDCYVTPHWLESLVKEFDQDGALSGLGGRVELHDPADLPIAVRTSNMRMVLGNKADVLQYMLGNNIAYRRHVFDVIHGYDERMGPGKSLPAAEDIDLNHRAISSGFKLVFCPDALVYHDHGRRSSEDKAMILKSYCLGRGSFYCKHLLGGDLTVARWAYWETRNLIGDWFNAAKDQETQEDSRFVLKYILMGFLKGLPIFLFSKARQGARA